LLTAACGSAGEEAPAGIEADLSGVNGLSVALTDGENGRLNPVGINCLYTFPVIGSVVWGVRTLRRRPAGRRAAVVCAMRAGGEGFSG